MQERDDKRTLGVTPSGARALEALMDTGWFNEEMDAYLLAVSIALAQGLVKDQSEMSGVYTKWNVGTLESEGRLRSLVTLMAKEPVDRPYAYAERCAIAGLEYLKVRLVDENAMLSEVIDTSENSM